MMKPHSKPMVAAFLLLAASSGVVNAFAPSSPSSSKHSFPSEIVKTSSSSTLSATSSTASSRIPFGNIFGPRPRSRRNQQPTTNGGSKATTIGLSTPARVKREYEQWNWQYTDPKTGQTQSYRINYRAEGPLDGIPILLTHGFGANLNHFRYQYKALEQVTRTQTRVTTDPETGVETQQTNLDSKYRVYSLDLLGFGASEKPAGAPYSIQLFAQQMQDFMTSRQETELQQPNPEWIMIGNSMGSLASLQVAANQVDKENTLNIAALVLLNSAGGMTGFRYQDVPVWAHPIMGHFQYYLLGRQHGPFLYQTLVNKGLIQFILNNLYQDNTHVNEDLLDILLQPAADVGAEQVFLKVFSGPPGPTREELLQTIAKSDSAMPILTLWGQEDNFTPLDDDVKALPLLYNQDAHQTADSLSKMTLDIIPNAGHCLHDEHPGVVNAKVLDFLESIVPPQANDEKASTTAKEKAQEQEAGTSTSYKQQEV